MILRSFLNFDKNFFYKQPQDKYQEFCNAYAYHKQAVLCDPKLNRQKLMQECIDTWKEVKEHDAAFIENKIREYYSTIPPTIHSHQRFFLSHRTPNTPTTPTTPSASKPLTSEHTTEFVGVDTTTI